MSDAVQIKRIYDPVSPDDGRRILVDRLWPRGVAKADAALDLWLKDVAPSTELRKWFAHRADRWDGFRTRYLAELQSSPAVEELRALADAGPVTLLYAARDRDHNEAVLLADLLRGPRRKTHRRLRHFGRRGSVRTLSRVASPAARGSFAVARTLMTPRAQSKDHVMFKKILAAAMITAVVAPVTLATPVAARDKHYSTYRGDDGRYRHYRCKRSKGTTGLIAGGAGGALAANALGGGTLGTVAGGVGGALLGKHLDKKHDRAQNRRNGC